MWAADSQAGRRSALPAPIKAGPSRAPGCWGRVGVTGAPTRAAGRAFPRRRASRTTRKEARRGGGFSRETPRRGLGRERSGDRKPSGVSTCASREPSPLIARVPAPGVADRLAAAAPPVRAGVDAALAGVDEGALRDAPPDRRPDRPLPHVGGRAHDHPPPRCGGPETGGPSSAGVPRPGAPPGRRHRPGRPLRRPRPGPLRARPRRGPRRSRPRPPAAPAGARRRARAGAARPRLERRPRPGPAPGRSAGRGGSGP